VELSEVMRTSGAVREFTADDQVQPNVLYRVLDNARFAPSGGNQQGWHVIVVRDPTLRRRLAGLSVAAFRRYVAEQSAGYRAFSVVDPAPIDVEIPDGIPTDQMLAAIENALEVLVVTVDLRTLAVLDRDLDRPSIVGGASIYPFVQNILLAARDEGLGGAVSTFMVAGEREAALLLNLPRDHAIAAMIQLGKPLHQVTRLTRNPVESFATVDRFDGDVLSGGGPARTS
jgi:nitroreductase